MSTDYTYRKIDINNKPFILPHHTKYQIWIEQLHDELLNMQNSIQIWKIVTEIENNSDHFKKYGGHFQVWQNENFAYKIIVQLSRITEKAKEKDDRSFYAFLIELRDKQVISYQQYRNLWSEADMKSAGFEEQDIQQIFEYKTNCKYTDNCFCKMYKADIEQLEKISESVRKIRNKLIAHLTKYNEELPNIKYEDVINYTQTLDELVNKYSQLLFGYYRDHQYIDLDVNTLFKKAWIVN